VSWTDQFLVSSDEELFVKFLSCEYSATDWRLLTLSQFRCPHEFAVQWLDACTPVGRMVLANSFLGLSNMMEVHFDPCFSLAFQRVYEFLVSPSSRAVVCQDIFLKVHCDFLVAGFFGDLRRSKSVQFRDVVDFSLASPEGCLKLLKLHVASFLADAESWEVSPHPLFYNDDRWVRRVIVDEKTFRKLAVKANWPASGRVYGFQSSGAAVVGSSQGEPRASTGGVSPAYRGSICVWDVAKQLQVTTKRRQLSCNGGCLDGVHRKLNLLSVADVLNQLQRVSMSSATKELIVAAVNRSKRLFRS
jgi:hypothetical protein